MANFAFPTDQRFAVPCAFFVRPFWVSSGGEAYLVASAAWASSAFSAECAFWAASLTCGARAIVSVCVSAFFSVREAECCLSSSKADSASCAYC
jgi:hypothetical protein